MKPADARPLICPCDPQDCDGLADWAGARAQQLGFAAVGICDAAPSQRGDQLQAWLSAGKHGSMEWMANNIAVRLDPAKLVVGAQSIVVVADRYHDGRPDARPVFAVNSQTMVEEPAGRAARYARGRDYHRRIKKRLRRLQREIEAALPGARGKVCCDIEPVMEREMAQRAGVGRIGKHTLLIAPQLGSWVLLACYVTTVRLKATTQSAIIDTDPCGTCTRCIDACPTGAITPWSVDGAKCISGITIEERGMADPQYASKAQDWLLGCDICQEVCPHNQPTRLSRSTGFHPEYDGRNAAFSLNQILGWDEPTRRAAFGPSPLNRVRVTQLRRNAVWCALEVLERSIDLPLSQALAQIATDAGEDPVVRTAAQEVLQRLAQR
ncbi:MAG: tRNA epoxyqueuosine(34) reductase QueG [Phycisphaerales bacterium]|nr:tRNA epoxyqueuosine(34) reductase QueG [Phycisphaerales bacterium]